jgi:hypothetical protein
MTFELLCMGLIGLLFGLAVTFGGYRLFLVLLPIWGFFFGFFLGAETLQAIFGIGFLATVISWVAGFIVGAIFAILSYLFYIFAVAILSFSAGYGLAVGILEAIGLNFGFLLWLIAVVIGLAVAVVVLVLNIQKYAVIVITALGGTAAIIYTLLALFGGFSLVELLLGPVRLAIQNSFWWLLFFVVLAGAGIVVQIRANQGFEVETYNRLVEA